MTLYPPKLGVNGGMMSLRNLGFANYHTFPVCMRGVVNSDVGQSGVGDLHCTSEKDGAL